MKNKLNLVEHFSVIRDPRLDRHKKYELVEIIVITICGVISGCNSFVDIANYGRSKEAWLKKFLKLKHGTPSNDTLGRVFSLVNALEMQKVFYGWTSKLPKLGEEIINIDGKYIKSSHGASKNKKRSIFGMVNAWASQAGVALAQLRVDYEQKDEKQGFRELIEFLELEGALVTMDANGTHADILNKIVDKKADYLTALKGNQRFLYCRSKQYLEEAAQKKLISVFSTQEKDHGRIERRLCEAVDFDDDFLKALAKKTARNKESPWIKLRSLCRISSEREVKGKITFEQRYYLSSLKADAQRMLFAARSHWSVENRLHWTLDVSFDEDACRIRSGYAGENMAVIRQLAVNLLKQDKSSKKSIKSKRLTCGWEDDYLQKIISAMNQDNFVF